VLPSAFLNVMVYFAAASLLELEEDELEEEDELDEEALDEALEEAGEEVLALAEEL
jgi:hypothetical protein